MMFVIQAGKYWVQAVCSIGNKGPETEVVLFTTGLVYAFVFHDKGAKLVVKRAPRFQTTQG